MDRDPAYLLDMLQAAKEARGLCAGLTWETFERSKLHQYAIVKVIEIIGEAARCVSAEMKAAHPEVPWVAIINMRNHLIHRYFRIDPAAIWDVIQNHLEPLIVMLEPLVPPEDLSSGITSSESPP